MKELEAVDSSDPRFEELMRQLETTLRDHISHEESDQFPQLRAQVPRDELVQVARDLGIKDSRKSAEPRMAPQRSLGE